MSKTLPFEKALCLTKTDRKIESDTITRQIQAIETKAKVLDFKTTQVQVPESSPSSGWSSSFTIQEEVSITSNSEVVPLTKIAILEHMHPIMFFFLQKAFQKYH